MWRADQANGFGTNVTGGIAGPRTHSIGSDTSPFPSHPGAFQGRCRPCLGDCHRPMPVVEAKAE